MAYRRSICSRATLFAKRFNPSFTYIAHNHNHDDSGRKNESGETGYRKVEDFMSQRRSYGTYRGNLRGPMSLFNQERLVFGGIGGGVGCHHRFMSTSMGEGVDKAEYLSDSAGIVSDAPVEEIVAQTAPLVSEVAAAAADSAYPVAALQYVIEAVHSVSGLNWWASIVLTTLLIRGATVPFLINQLKSTSKLSIMRPRLEEIKEEMTATGDPAAVEEGRKKMNALFKEYGVTPFTPLKGLLIQGPVFVSFFLAISNMAEKVPSFKNGGAFWFTDLSTPDSMYILPVLTAVTFLITVEFNMQEGMEGNPVAGTMKKFSRGLAVLTVPFTMSFPKAIFCYWITSNIFSFAYGGVLKIPGVKKALGVPEVPVAPPSKSTQPGFSFLEALKQASGASKTPAAISAGGEPKPAANGKKTPPASSTVLSQRIKSLERQVKHRKKNKRL